MEEQLRQSTETRAKKYYRIKEAAALFSISEKTIRRWITERYIKAVRIGGRSIRIPITEIDRLITPINQ